MLTSADQRWKGNKGFGNNKNQSFLSLVAQPKLLLLHAGPMDSYNLPANLTTNDNPLAGKPLIATLATALLSFTGFQGWLKLFLIGAIFETCRRIHAWGSIVDSFWITVDIEEYNWGYCEYFPATSASDTAVPPRRVLTIYRFYRLDVVMAVATSNVEKGEEVFHPRFGARTGTICG